jgi:hypothetical protein
MPVYSGFAMNHYRRARCFLGLRQIDISNGTGIPLQRLSLAERGLIALNAVEESILSAYLRGRIEAVVRMGEADSRDGIGTAPATVLRGELG